MAVPLFDNATPVAPLRETILERIAEVVAGGQFILGPNVTAFEDEFAAYLGARHVIGVANGTDAITVALRALGVTTGDDVVVPALTFYASAEAVVNAGARPVFCDVDFDTRNVTVDTVRAALTPRTTAIVSVDLFGLPAPDLSELGLPVLEDAAQAAGARYRGRRAGSLGAAAAFSFYPGKNLGALGDGGAVCTDDAQLAATLRRLRNLGQRAKGEHVDLGYNERLDGLQAALLRVKLAHLDDWNEARRERAGRYRELLSPAITLVQERPESPCTYHLFPTRFAQRDAVADALRAAGIETGVHYARPVHHHAAWIGRPLVCDGAPVAEAWAAEELSLPMHSDLTDTEIQRVAGALDVALTTKAI